MGSRPREDNGRGRAVPEPSLRRSRRTRRRWATTRVAPTETGMGVGGVGKMGPRIRVFNGGGGRFPNRPYVGVAEHDVGWATTRVAPTEGMGVGGVGVGPRIREDNGRGRAVPEPPLRGSRRTRRRRATTRVAPTETGMGVGGVGKTDGSPHPRGQREGEGGSRTAPTWESPNTT